MKVHKKTYLQRTLTDGSITGAQEVESRDWEKMDLPPDTESFFFFDQAVAIEEIDGDEFKWYSTPTNESSWYYINARLLSLEEFKLEFADNPYIDEMVEQMEQKNVETMIITASGQITYYEEGDILLDSEDI